MRVDGWWRTQILTERKEAGTKAAKENGREEDEEEKE